MTLTLSHPLVWVQMRIMAASNIIAGLTLAQVEIIAITMALKDCAGNRKLAAKQLGIGERTLYRKIKETANVT